ncbi:14873_t:CDS:2 [Cetraspora pellucida]|uniref:14873_t:CDS:1 n=1 Tax=Cetraspora pellucida TaxID=1433469 RepID=A0ACA9K839_9GLOM|nr:14873_t:CDS:2 [Cetraspora pellucida]
MLELSKLPNIHKILTAKLISADEEKDSQIFQLEGVESNGVISANIISSNDLFNQ